MESERSLQQHQDTNWTVFGHWREGGREGGTDGHEREALEFVEAGDEGNFHLLHGCSRDAPRIILVCGCQQSWLPKVPDQAPADTHHSPSLPKLTVRVDGKGAKALASNLTGHPVQQNHLRHQARCRPFSISSIPIHA